MQNHGSQLYSWQERRSIREKYSKVRIFDICHIKMFLYVVKFWCKAQLVIYLLVLHSHSWFYGSFVIPLLLKSWDVLFYLHPFVPSFSRTKIYIRRISEIWYRGSFQSPILYDVFRFITQQQMHIWAGVSQSLLLTFSLVLSVLIN